jgi:hypothetical protein
MIWDSSQTSDLAFGFVFFRLKQVMGSPKSGLKVNKKVTVFSGYLNYFQNLEVEKAPKILLFFE